MTVEFEVVGLPAPQGSKTLMPNGALLDGKSPAARARHKAWRNAVAAAAMATGHHYDCPLSVRVHFQMPMPKSRPAADRNRGWCWHAVKPDLDKLLRSTLDGITDGGLIKDDSRVASISATATEFDGEPFAVITIEELGYP